MSLGVARLALAAAVVVPLAAAGCLPGGDQVSSYSREQALEMLERYARETAALIDADGPPPRPAGHGAVPCGEQTAPGPSGRYLFDSGYWLPGVPRGADAGPLFDRFVAHWAGRGFRTVSDDRPNSRDVVVGSADGFRIGLRTGQPGGEVAVVVTSPCIRTDAPDG